MSKTVEQLRAKYTIRDIANATFREFTRNGGQVFDLDRNVHGWPVTTLTGITRGYNLTPGDTGKIVYSTTPSSGLFFFRKGQFVEGQGHVDEARTESEAR